MAGLIKISPSVTLRSTEVRVTILSPGTPVTSTKSMLPPGVIQYGPGDYEVETCSLSAEMIFLFMGDSGDQLRKIPIYVRGNIPVGETVILDQSRYGGSNVFFLRR